MPQQLPLSSDLSIDDVDVERILDRLDAECGSAAHENRAAPRHPLRGRAVCVILVHPHATEALRVRLRNLSMSGVAFLSGKQLPPGTRIQLLMPHAVAAGVGDQIAVVRHVRVVEAGVFEIGASFTG